VCVSEKTSDANNIVLQLYLSGFARLNGWPRGRRNSRRGGSSSPAVTLTTISAISDGAGRFEYENDGISYAV
jgi:hypothetical protein